MYKSHLVEGKIILSQNDWTLDRRTSINGSSKWDNRTRIDELIKKTSRKKDLIDQ